MKPLRKVKKLSDKGLNKQILKKHTVDKGVVQVRELSAKGWCIGVVTNEEGFQLSYSCFAPE